MVQLFLALVVAFASVTAVADLKVRATYDWQSRATHVDGPHDPDVRGVRRADLQLRDRQGTVSATVPKRGGNPVAAKTWNPVPSTDASVAAGRQTYRTLCSRCHGASGKGDGGGAGAGGQPADFTDDVWEFGSSDGEIFAAIAEGTSADMESYADRITPTEIWNLVNYLRTLKP